MLRRRHRNIDPYVITDPSQARKQERMLPEIWDERFPEQERRYLDPRTCGEIEPAPSHVVVAFEEAFHEELREGIVFLGIDPWLKRVCVWQKRQSLYGDGEVVERALIFSSEFDPDDGLPADLAWENHDGRYDRYQGCIGEYWEPTLEDFAVLKDKVDHWKNSGRDLTVTRNWILKMKVDKERAEWRSSMNRIHDAYRDAQRYSFSMWHAVAKRIVGGGQGYDFMPVTSLDQLKKDMKEEGINLKVEIPVYNEVGHLLYHEIIRKPDNIMNPIFVRRLNPDGTFTQAIASLPAPIERVTMDELIATIGSTLGDKSEEYMHTLTAIHESALAHASASPHSNPSVPPGKGSR